MKLPDDPELHEYKSGSALFVLGLKIILGILAVLVILSLIGEQLLPQ